MKQVKGGTRNILDSPCSFSPSPPPPFLPVVWVSWPSEKMPGHSRPPVKLNTHCDSKECIGTRQSPLRQHHCHSCLLAPLVPFSLLPSFLHRDDWSKKTPRRQNRFCYCPNSLTTKLETNLATLELALFSPPRST